jgi:O-antigen ligase
VPTVRVLERAAFAVLLMAVAFAPLALGSTEAWSILGLRLLAAAALTLLATAAALRGRWPAPPRLLTVALLGYLALVLVSFAANPSSLESSQSAQLIATYVLGFFLAAGLVTSARRAAWFVAVALSTSFVMAAYGVLQAAGAGVTPSMSIRVSSTYFNPNHYAGFLDLMLPLALSVALFARPLTLRFVTGGLALLLYANVALSASRGAWLALALTSTALVAGWVAIGSRGGRGWTRLLAVVLASLVVGLGTWWVLDANPARSGYLQDRVTKIRRDLANLEDVGRVVIFRAGAKVVMERPLIGVGPGHFIDAVAVYAPARVEDLDPDTTERFVDHAHNDYLQVASETGLISLAFFLLFWSIVLVGRSQRSPAIRWGLTAGLAALLIHGLVDGNLTMIPSNAFLAYVAAGVLHARWRGVSRTARPAAT